MSACGGYLEGALCLELTAHVCKIELWSSRREVKSAALVRHRHNFFCTAKMIDELTKSSHGVDGDTVDDRRLACILLGNEELASAELARRNRHREHALNASDLTRERELAHKALIRKIKVARNHAVALKYRRDNGEVEGSSLLLDVGRREIYHYIE